MRAMNPAEELRASSIPVNDEMLVAKILACTWIYVAPAPALKLGRWPRWLLLLNTFLVFDAGCPAL